MPAINPFQQFGNYSYPGGYGAPYGYSGGIPGVGYSTAGAGTSTAGAASGFDPLTLALQAGGAWLSNNQQQAGANGAIGMSGYYGTGINGPGGMGVSSNGLGYNVNGPTSGPFANFGGFANNAIGYGANNAGTNPFDTAAGSTLSAFQNFDPSAFANTEYGQLAAMSAPGMTNQTQSMENYEQASGRNGLTQNGQLGDMGGLALAQNLTDTNNKLQAVTDARNQGNYLANLASTFSGDASALRTSADSSAGAGLNGELGINSALQQYLQASIAASGARANAGANQGNFRYMSGNNSSNAYGNFFGGLGQILNNNGGASNLLKQGYNWLTGAGGGSGMGSVPAGFSTGGTSLADSAAEEAANSFGSAGGQAATSSAASASGAGSGVGLAPSMEFSGAADTTAADSAAGGAASSASGSGAGAASGGLGALGPALAVAAPLAMVALGAEQSPVTLSGQYMNGLTSALQNNPKGSAAYNNAAFEIAGLLGNGNQHNSNGALQQLVQKYGLQDYMSELSRANAPGGNLANSSIYGTIKKA